MKLVLSISLLFAAAMPAAAQPVTVSVHADAPGPTYDRRIFGQFAEHLGTGIYGGIWVGKNSAIANDQGYRRDVVAALKALDIPFVRWPGGCFADNYHWRDGIGTSRRTGTNLSWGGVPEPNNFGTHEFFGLLDRLGADAYISGNVGSAPPAEFAEWLGYLTAPAATTLGQERATNGHSVPWRVAIAGIGNELWGCGGNMRAEYAADVTARYAAFARSENGAMLKIASGPADDDTDWTDAVMRIAGKSIDGLSLHYYTVPGGWERKSPATGFGEREWAETLALTQRMDKLITDHSAVMDKYDPAKTKILAVDEWGSWYQTLPGKPALWQQNSLRDAMLAAVNLNIFAAHAERVKIAAIAQMVNVLQAMILTDGPRMIRTPTYWTYWLYRPWQDATVLPISVASPAYTFEKFSQPAVSVSVVRGRDKAIHIALTNIDPSHAHVVTIDGVIGRSVKGQILTGPAIDSHNDFGSPDLVRPQAFSGATIGPKGVTVTVPPRALVMLSVP